MKTENYQVVRPINAHSGPYDFEVIKSEFQSILQAVRWGQKRMRGLPFDVVRDGEPLSTPEREEMANLL
jgi:hypothetical protein